MARSSMTEFNRAVPIGVIFGFRRKAASRQPRFPKCVLDHDSAAWDNSEHDTFEHILLGRVASEITFDETIGMYVVCVRTDRMGISTDQARELINEAAQTADKQHALRKHVQHRVDRVALTVLATLMSVPKTLIAGLCLFVGILIGWWLLP
jgi:hypothetical protein